MADRNIEDLLAKALPDGDARKVAVGAAVAGGAAAAAKLGWDRLTGREDPRKFGLREGEPVPEGLERVALGQLDGSIEGLAGEGDADAATAIHEARKSMKRLRATLRLARDQLGDEVYQRENAAFRDAGRRLSGARDSRVLLDTLAALSERHPSKAPASGLLPFKRTLLSRHANTQRRLRADDTAGETLRALRQARSRVPYWPLEDEGIASLRPGFERIYRRGRKAYRNARKEPTTENFHELRKRAKDLWYASQIVRPASPKRMKRIATAAHELSDLIGEDHDFALLAESAAARPDRFAGEASLDDLLKLIERRRKELQRKALKLGDRLYESKPRAVGRRLEDTAVNS
jgi:CHAD domain-containing protein